MTAWVWGLACRPDGVGKDREPDPEPTAGPRILSLAVETPELAPLARRLTLDTDVPTRVRVRLEGDGVDLDVAYPALSTHHELPVLGAKPDRWLDVTVTVEDGQGRTDETSSRFRTEPFGGWFPDVTVRRRDPGATARYVLAPLQTPSGLHWLAVLDTRDGEVVWVWTGADDFGDIDVTPRGTLEGLVGDGILEIDWLGGTVRRGRPAASAGAGDVPLGAAGFNHELLETDDGWVTIASRSTVAPKFPLSYDAPDTFSPDVGIVAQDIVHLGFDGRVRARWPLDELLDTRRIGFDSLDPLGGGYDWSHANAVLRDGDGWVVSVRHQDALVALDAGGGLRWILSNPYGWLDEDLRDAVLDGLGDGEWPLHPHGPAWDAAGNLVVFDNGNEGWTPYEAGPTRPLVSRVRAYAVDEARHRVSPAWTWSPPGVDLYSPALGNVAPLPDGHVLATYGFVSAEDGVDNLAAGRPMRSIRLFDLTPGRDAPWLDLSVDADPAVLPDGVKVYRMIPVDALYPPSVVVTDGAG